MNNTDPTKTEFEHMCSIRAINTCFSQDTLHVTHIVKSGKSPVSDRGKTTSNIYRQNIKTTDRVIKNQGGIIIDTVCSQCDINKYITYI